MSVKIFKNFLTQTECQELNSIALQGIEEGWCGKGLDPVKGVCYSLRYTSRMHMKDVEYPQFVRDISNKIREFMKINSFPLIEGHGKDGVVVSITLKNGSVHEHRDPLSIDGLPTYRCNVLTQANESGCDLYVDGKHVDIEVGDLHCYMVSALPHFVTEAKGNTPRIMWMFGAHIPKAEEQKYL